MNTLPPLPAASAIAAMDLCADHQGPVEACAFLEEGEKLFTADQMRSYAAAALAAERERQHEQMRQLMSELIFDEPAALAEPDVPETRFGDMPERLRTYSADTELSDRYSDAMQEAADEIERLGAALAAAQTVTPGQWEFLAAAQKQLDEGRQRREARDERLAAAVAEPVALREVANYIRASDISEGIKAQWLDALAAPPQRERCWACGNTGSVTTSSNGSGLIEVPCEDCAPKEQA